MIKKVLVANRGEVAVRIIRACREMNINTVAVYSTADKDELFVTLATESVCIGGPRPADSYLNMQNILAAAAGTGCDAVHPGFGFLAESPGFAEKTAECGLVFVGPRPETIRAFGDKSAARALMKESGVPVVPGSDGVVGSARQAVAAAEKIGYPVLIKAAAGGGGKGMRRVMDAAELPAAFDAAAAEAASAFGDGSVYIEKLIESPRHIEFQILADNGGRVLHLGERECSVQRLNQKILEESPSHALSEELRREMGAAAVKAAKAAGYCGVGTVEFVLDGDGSFFFIEMNTRLQVEHPVTEMVTGLDIVREQIRIASGMDLKLSEDDIRVSGHAIECRVNAEDPARGFLPCPGRVEHLHLPGGYGVRVDTALFSGCLITPYYDSMLAKIVVLGKTRREAIQRMRRALEETIITGVKTNIGLLYMILYHPDFLKGRYDTSFLEKNMNRLLNPMGSDVTL